MVSPMHPETSEVRDPGWPQEGLELRSASTQRVRGTQSFVYTMMWCWQHPSVLALEVAWRWGFGVLALGLVWIFGRPVAAQVTGGTFDPSRLGLNQLTVTDPMGTAGHMAAAMAVLGPACWPVMRWLGPSLLAGWIVASAVGRTVVLRRADPTLSARPLTLIALQTLRVLALSGSFLVWFRVLLWAARVAISGPIDSGREPNLLLYFVVLILGTLGLFALWAVVSWWLSIAPLMAMLHNAGVWESLRASFRLRALRQKLVEINLVMGIVKIALVVLAMVFSATPLPFESVTTPTFLAGWWLGVTVLYLLGSDFFHVARLIAYLRLWRSTQPAANTEATA